MLYVCKEYDDYLGKFAEKNAIWYVTLSNGETVYQDDGRPNVEPSSAWVRLKDYCGENNVYIEEMFLKYRSNVIKTASNVKGYYFCKSVSGLLFSDETRHSYVVGSVDGDKVSISSWKTPELTPEFSEIRPRPDSDECIIESKRIIDGGPVTVRMSAPFKMSMLNWLGEDGKEQDGQE
tara:strand:- start:21742 stop:22275 length:534 start_codon:yes stop_codon:yes gene_type:complete